MWNTWSWEDQKSIKERLGIIFQNGILEHVDWEEWVWLVASVRIYMSFTRWHPTVQESVRGSALRLCLSNIPKVTIQGTLLDSMQSVKSNFRKYGLWEFDVLFIHEIWSSQMVKLKWRIINLKLYRRIIIPVCLSRIKIETMEGFRVWNRGRCFRIIFVSIIVCFLDKSGGGNIMRLFVLTIRKACQQTPEV